MRHMKNIKVNRVCHILLVIGVCMSVIPACRQQPKENEGKREQKRTTLYDKSLPEIKEQVNGTWALVHGKNSRESSEYENTFIVFDNDKYIWIEDRQEEPGDLNWRKSPTGNGYDAYIMDAFYAEYPAYPLAINGDTLYLQDISETNYKYTLIRKR